MTKPAYFKRYRMELDLRLPRSSARLPDGFDWVPWSGRVLEPHAQVKFRCFAEEIDAVVFPSLGHLSGCRDLMTAIVTRPGFCPSATWLVSAGGELVGTVQGLLDSSGFGGVQNLGVVPEYRGQGIGPALLLKALDGFVTVGAQRAFLEVTARNEPAVRMYRRIGFRCYKTIYREVRVRETDPVPADPVGVGL
jgi:ribosomal protein S18 acetylase RimI-like enzyme